MVKIKSKRIRIRNKAWKKERKCEVFRENAIIADIGLNITSFSIYLFASYSEL